MKKTFAVALVLVALSFCGGVSVQAVDGKDFCIPDLNLEMVYVAPGTFVMGSETGEAQERPTRQVTISRGFYLSRTEITQAQWQAVRGTNPSMAKGDLRPVDNVTLVDGLDFCHELMKREKQAGRLPEGMVYRLPTEAEWEFAARGGGKSRAFSFSGSNSLDEVGWTTVIQPVGEKITNELGLHDMSGNVGEWCLDWYAKYPATAQTDPTGPASGTHRIVRGGVADAESGDGRVTARRAWEGKYRSERLGLRLALGSAALLNEADRKRLSTGWEPDRNFTPGKLQKRLKKLFAE